MIILWVIVYIVANMMFNLFTYLGDKGYDLIMWIVGRLHSIVKLLTGDDHGD